MRAKILAELAKHSPMALAELAWRTHGHAVHSLQDRRRVAWSLGWLRREGLVRRGAITRLGLAAVRAMVADQPAVPSPASLRVAASKKLASP